jgi:hypothetical protein
MEMKRKQKKVIYRKLDSTEVKSAVKISGNIPELDEFVSA